MDQYTKRVKKLLGPQIEDELIDYILREKLEVGAKLPNEFELASMFGVGRSTIREAVKALVSKGVLTVRRGDGTYVQSLQTPENDPLGLSRLGDRFKLALELFDVRLMVEPEVAALAAEHATEADKKRLVELCDATEQLYLSGGDHIPKDVEFHKWIAQCSGNRVVELLIPITNTAVFTFANLTKRKLKDETITTHREITNAILRGDSTGARCAMIMHLTYNRQMLIRLQEEQRRGGDGGAAPEQDEKK